MQDLRDAGGGTRTPDTRIMIGALALVFARAEGGFVGFGGVGGGQICRAGDTVWDTDWGGLNGATSWARSLAVREDRSATRV